MAAMLSLRRTRRVSIPNPRLGIPKSAVDSLGVRQLPFTVFADGTPVITTAVADNAAALPAAEEPVQLPEYDIPEQAVREVIDLMGSDACSICFEDDIDAVISCSNDHHVCKDCIDGTVSAECQRVRGMAVMSSPGFKCSCCDDVLPFHRLPVRYHTQLLTALQQNATNVAQIAAAQQQQAQAQAAVDRTAVINKHVSAVQAILRHTCPQCGDQYEGFTACAALTCFFCRQIFCAHCDRKFDLKLDCHRHITECANNPMPGYYSMSMEVYNKARNKRWMIKVKDYFHNNVPPALKADVIEGILERLIFIGVSANELI